MAKAIVLLSGGLDSTLAAKVILEQGIELEAVNFLTVFCNCTHRGKTCLASKSAADKLGIELRVFEVSKEYFEPLPGLPGIYVQESRRVYEESRSVIFGYRRGSGPKAYVAEKRGYEAYRQRERTRGIDLEAAFGKAI